MVRVKICGVRTDDVADACAEARADYAGLNFVPTSKRAIDHPTAARLARRLGAVSRVGVFVNPSLDDVLRAFDAGELDHAQLHGDEAPEACEALARRGLSVIKAMKDGFDPASLEAYVPFVSAFLFDAREPGAGRTFDWTRLRGLPRPRPVFLAGGLDAANVARAIQAVRPDAVDTASGAESGGVPSAEAVRAFIRAARGLP